MCSTVCGTRQLLWLDVHLPIKEGNMKSQASTLLEVATAVINDSFARCTVIESAVRDLLTLRSRYEQEGYSFLTITLPSFGVDFERSLANGRIDSSLFRAFRKSGLIPSFLRGITSLVFNADTGCLHSDPSILAIESIRQIAYTFKKLNLPCADFRVKKTIDGYLNDELALNVPCNTDDVDFFSSRQFRLMEFFIIGFISESLDLHSTSWTWCYCRAYFWK